MSCAQKIPGCFGCKKKGWELREFKNHCFALQAKQAHFFDSDSLDVWRLLGQKNLHNPKRSVVSWTWSNAHFMPYSHQAPGCPVAKPVN